MCGGDPAPARNEVLVFNVCPRCGEYSVEKRIDPSGPFAICPFCGHAHPFVQFPLFVITGASGAGKSAICLALAPALIACICLESDILWRAEFASPDDGYRTYRDLWLRVAKNVGQGGRPVALFGSAVPEQFETCPERRYFTDLHYLALVCNDDLLAQRLRRRPAWRGSGTEERVADMVRFNRWLRENAAHTDPPMATLDTSVLTVEQAASRTAMWIEERLRSIARAAIPSTSPTRGT
jgi:hypothetical protein